MNASEIIALVALFISIASAWISFRAHRYAINAREQEVALSFSREKSEFLARIDKARRLFDELERCLKTQLRTIEGAPPERVESLVSEVDQIGADLTELEGCQRQVWSLWHETYEMNQSGLAHHKPRFLGLIEDDERYVESAMIRCAKRDEKIVTPRATAPAP